LNIAYNLLAGGTCLEHLELRRSDEAYLDALGARRVPDPTTLHNDGTWQVLNWKTNRGDDGPPKGNARSTTDQSHSGHSPLPAAEKMDAILPQLQQETTPQLWKTLEQPTWDATHLDCVKNGSVDNAVSIAACVGRFLRHLGPRLPSRHSKPRKAVGNVIDHTVPAIARAGIFRGDER
jgi:hypothetical protein